MWGVELMGKWGIFPHHTFNVYHSCDMNKEYDKKAGPVTDRLSYVP